MIEHTYTQTHATSTGAAAIHSHLLPFDAAAGPSSQHASGSHQLPSAAGLQAPSGSHKLPSGTAVKSAPSSHKLPSSSGPGLPLRDQFFPQAAGECLMLCVVQRCCSVDLSESVLPLPVCYLMLVSLTQKRQFTVLSLSSSPAQNAHLAAI